MKVLVTGGAGYIGRTVCSALEDNGHIPIILDSFVSGKKEFTNGQISYQGDIADKNLLKQVVTEHPDIACTIHLAALIVVPESVEKPSEYYNENVVKSLELFKNLNSFGYKNIVFSSSASIYDDVADFFVTEESPLNPRSPYARTKFMMEMVLEDFCTAYGMKGIALRYFNPIGADPKLRSGSYIKHPSHLLGKLLESSSNDETFNITGTNWSTRDGSGIRDYIHVWDLALAHVKAVDHFDRAFQLSDNPDCPFLVLNLGSGSGVTVKEFVSAFEKVYGKQIRKEETGPRMGDVAGSYANADKARKLIDWTTTLSIEDGIRDSLRWNEVRARILQY